MSYIATAVRVRQASAAAIGEWNCRRPRVALRRQPLGGSSRPGRRWPRTSAGAPSRALSRNTAPSSCCRAWNGLTRRSRGESRGLQRVQDVVDLDEVLLRGFADVVGCELDLFEAVHVASCRSISLRPSTSSCATARATPAEWVTHTASAIQNPATSGDSPISGPPSGVNEKMPLNPLSILAVSRQGSSSLHCSQAGAKSSSVKGSIDGIADAEIVSQSGSVAQVHRHRAVGVGADAEPVDVFAEVQVLVLVAQDRQAGLGSSVLRPTSSGTGRSWRTGGPAAAAARPCRPSRRARRPRIRAQDTTMSAGIVAGRCRDAGDPAAAVLDAGHLVDPLEHRAACLGAAGQRDDDARRPWRARRWAHTARQGSASRSSSGCSRRIPRRRCTVPSIPHEVAQPCLRCSRPGAPAVVATSSPPTWLKHHCPSTSRQTNFSTVYRRTPSSSSTRWSGRPDPGRAMSSRRSAAADPDRGR